MARGIFGSVIKSVIVGLVASYAIKYIQDKLSGEEGVSDNEVSKAE